MEKIIDDYERALPVGAWPNWVLGNHDRPRVASRVGMAQAGVAAMLLLTLRGTPTMYYGDEIGMQQVAIAPDQVRDPFEKNGPGLGGGRDGRRTRRLPYADAMGCDCAWRVHDGHALAAACGKLFPRECSKPCGRRPL